MSLKRTPPNKYLSSQDIENPKVTSAFRTPIQYDSEPDTIEREQFDPDFINKNRRTGKRRAIGSPQTGDSANADNMSSIMAELRMLFNTQTERQEKQLKEMKDLLEKQNSEIKDSIQFLSNKYDLIKEEIDSIRKHQKDQDRRICEVTESCNSDKLNMLEAKIDSLEQQARQCNVEICNLPEKRNENLLAVVESIGKIVNVQLSPNDILSVHRVPHASQLANKPKNVIVKLKSKIVRDNLITAYKLKKNIQSDQLGIAGTSEKIFINEHLTLKNKMLFRKTKEAATKYGYKYVWIKNSTILVRERDGSMAYTIKSEGDLLKLADKHNAHSSASNK